MGKIPDMAEICKLEGIEIQGLDKDEDYLSDSGALVVEATRERDRFAGSLRGRHGTKNTDALKALDNAVMKNIKTYDAVLDKPIVVDEESGSK
jgi:hypothetical protein